MSVQIKVEIGEQGKQVISDLKQLPAAMLKGIAKAIYNENSATVGHIQRAYLSFPSDGPKVAIGCRYMTGRLRNTLRASQAVISGQTVSGSIGSNVKYAAAQEFGADIPARKIVPKPGNKALRFMIGDRVIFAKSVNLPAVHLPARGFVQRGIADRSQNYSNAVTKAIVDAWNAGAKSP